MIVHFFPEIFRFWNSHREKVHFFQEEVHFFQKIFPENLDRFFQFFQKIVTYLSQFGWVWTRLTTYFLFNFLLTTNDCALLPGNFSFLEQPSEQRRWRSVNLVPPFISAETETVRHRRVCVACLRPECFDNASAGKKSQHNGLEITCTRIQF